ncbi:hypothetical protein Tco_1095238 [Tanacetum coccineum]
MIVDESLEMIKDELLEMTEDESLHTIVDESLEMVDDESLDMIMDETLKLDELVRLIDVTIEQWLDLKYGDHTMKRGDDEEVITDDELSKPGDGNLIEETKIVEIFIIKTDIFQFKTHLCEAFKEFNYLVKIDVDVLTNDILGFTTYDEYKDSYEWCENLEDCELEDEALNNKAILEESMNVADEARNHYYTMINGRILSIQTT